MFFIIPQNHQLGARSSVTLGRRPWTSVWCLCSHSGFSGRRKETGAKLGRRRVDQRTDGVLKEGGCSRHSFPKRDRSRGGVPGSEAGPLTPAAAYTQGVCSKSKHLLRSSLLHHLSGDGGCSAHCSSLEGRQDEWAHSRGRKKALSRA